MYGETFYGRHTAQHQLQWSQIKIRNEIQLLLNVFLKHTNDKNNNSKEFGNLLIQWWNSEELEVK